MLKANNMKTSLYLILLFLFFGLWSCTPTDERIMTDYRMANEQAVKWISGWSAEQMVAVPFSEYDLSITQEENRLLAILKSVRNDSLRSAESRHLKLNMIGSRFMYAWALRNVKGERMDIDPNLVTFVRSIDLNDTDMMMDNMGIQVCDMRLRWEQGITPATENGRQIDYLNIVKQFITNQQVRNQMATILVESYLDGGGSELIKEVFACYRTLCDDSATIARLTPRYEELTVLSVGSPAPDFEMIDPQGRRSKLSDFKGKYVMMDIWATWCGPCKVEIPYFEKQYELFAGDSRIEFISISLDEKVDAWKKMLEDDKPQWKQFVVENGIKSDFCTRYFINSIPRFLLIDPQGNIVSVAVMRPSDKGFTEYIRKYLFN